MTDYREILRLHRQGISGRDIAASCGCSRNTVARVLGKSVEHAVSWATVEGMTNGEIRNLLFPVASLPSLRSRPDYEHVHREMAKSGVTLSLLWQEYCEGCRLNNEIPLMYSQFCNCYQKYAVAKKATMHITRKPGETVEVDWAGQKAFFIDPDTGEETEASIFVGVLSSSRYAYVEAFFFQDQESWITAHVNMFRFFGGAPRIIIPDNLKTGVLKPDRYDPVINRVYREMAEHYGVAVIPARVRKPRDKPNAEGTVGVVSTWIIAALRDRRFFSLRELNDGIREKLERFNGRPFQKKDGSRLEAFLEEEKPTLMPLPVAPYELSTWKTMVVGRNYHIATEKMYYSVPYEYIRHEVDVRITRNVIEVFFANQRICSHARLHGRPGQYSTVSAHMPEEHKKYLQWNAERFIAWAEEVGPNTTITIKGILSTHKTEQQSYRSCFGLVKLGDVHSFARLEAACAKALSYTPRPGYKNVRTILTTGQDKVDALPAPDADNTRSHGLTRGAEYYGRKERC